MTHDQDARDAAERYAKILYPENSLHDLGWRSDVKEHFLAGDTHGRMSERTRILDLLNGEEALERFYNPLYARTPEAFAAWLEEKLNENL